MTHIVDCGGSVRHSTFLIFLIVVVVIFSTSFSLSVWNSYRSNKKKHSFDSDSDSEDEINVGLRCWDDYTLTSCRPMYKSYVIIIDAIIDQILYYRRVHPTNYFQNYNFHGGKGSSKTAN